MKITILTLFPEMFVGPFSQSIIKRAQEKNFAEIQLVHIRDFGIGPHKVVDDKPYGGGVGMVMKVDVIDKALKSAKDTKLQRSKEKTVLLDPRGKQFKQSLAKDFATLDHLILLCGHYEGVDERVRSLVDMTISLGDFVVTGGEIPAMLITDSVIRLIPGVLKKDATSHESFSISTQAYTPDVQSYSSASNTSGVYKLLEYPQYTTPQEYKDMKVPDMLLSGNHKKIDEWREKEAVKITEKHRPDLL